MTRCGTLSQNGYGTQLGAIQTRSFLHNPENTKRKNKDSHQRLTKTRTLPSQEIGRGMRHTTPHGYRALKSRANRPIDRFRILRTSAHGNPAVCCNLGCPGRQETHQGCTQQDPHTWKSPNFIIGIRMPIWKSHQMISDFHVCQLSRVFLALTFRSYASKLFQTETGKNKS